MRRLLAVVAVSALAATASTMAATTPSAGAATARAAGDCRLVRLATPAGSPWGTVVDIERVHGRATYYGSLDRVRSDGTTVGRAVVWRGLRARPRYVGPKGWPINTAFELTRSGLVNGVSEDPESGAMRFWVQDLDDGRLRWFRTRLDGSPSADAWIRRINDRGAAVGAIQPADRENPAAVGYRPGSSRPFELPVPRRAAGAEASGINERGDRSGFWAEQSQVGDEPVALFRPTVWRARGGRVTLPAPGLDANARVVNDRDQAGGSGWWGDLATGHDEAIAWPSLHRAVPLGLLPGGGSSSVFGMDRAGRVVGAGDRFAPESPHAFPEDGTVQHSFSWTPGTGAMRVRVLPSLYAVRTGETDWREWHSTHAAHASHAGLDQIGAGTHVGFDETGAPVGAPTVFRNASRCGVVVPTTHEAFWEQGGGSARQAPADAVRSGMEQRVQDPLR